MNQKQNINRVLKIASVLLILMGIITLIMGLNQIINGANKGLEESYMATSLNLAFGILKIFAGKSLWNYDIKGYFMGIMLMSVQIAFQTIGLIKNDRVVYIPYFIGCIIITILLFLGINKFKDQIY